MEEYLLKMLTRKERAEALQDGISECITNLLHAETGENFEEVFDQIERVIIRWGNDPDLDLICYGDDIIGTIILVKKHDATRATLLALLNEYHDRIRAILQAEKSAKQIQKVREFLLTLADHAEEVSRIVGKEMF